LNGSDAARVRNCLAAIISAEELAVSRLTQNLQNLRHQRDELLHCPHTPDIMMRAGEERYRKVNLSRIDIEITATEKARQAAAHGLAVLRQKDDFVAAAERKTRKRDEQRRARRQGDD